MPHEQRKKSVQEKKTYHDFTLTFVVKENEKKKLYKIMF